MDEFKPVSSSDYYVCYKWVKESERIRKEQDNPEDLDTESEPNK